MENPMERNQQLGCYSGLQQEDGKTSVLGMDVRSQWGGAWHQGLEFAAYLDPPM